MQRSLPHSPEGSSRAQEKGPGLENQLDELGTRCPTPPSTALSGWVARTRLRLGEEDLDSGNPWSLTTDGVQRKWKLSGSPASSHTFATTRHPTPPPNTTSAEPLSTTRTFLTEKKEGEESIGGVKCLQIKDNDFSYRPNMICSFLHENEDDTVVAPASDKSLDLEEQEIQRKNNSNLSNEQGESLNLEVENSGPLLDIPSSEMEGSVFLWKLQILPWKSLLDEIILIITICYDAMSVPNRSFGFRSFCSQADEAHTAALVRNRHA
ncbi:hypothetical protein GH733_008133, partial [Mirounga leonina]